VDKETDSSVIRTVCNGIVSLKF